VVVDGRVVAIGVVVIGIVVATGVGNESVIKLPL
jgi:hypothetical protein